MSTTPLSCCTNLSDSRACKRDSRVKASRPCCEGSRVPALIVHGDQDGYVSYDIAREAATTREGCDFHTIKGTDHGFDSREREDEAIAVTVDWLLRRYA